MDDIELSFWQGEGDLLYYIFQTIYDVYLGPLSKIPGPKLAAATRLVIFYHRSQGNAEFWISSLHRRYGDVVRPAPDEISYASGHLWKEIYGHMTGSNSRVARTRKDPRFYDLKPLDINLVTSEDADHTRQRKLFSYAFSDRALVAQMPMLLGYVEQFMNVLRLASQSAKSDMKTVDRNESRQIDIAQAFNFMTFDIMAGLMFGEPLGCLRTGAYTPWIKLTFSSFKIFAMTNELNHFPRLRRFLEWLAPQNIKHEYEKHLAHAFAQVDRRLARTDENARTRPDIWTFVLNAKEEQKMRVSEMHSNANIFMLAGTETTATALSGLIYYLLQHPDKMERVTDEVRRAFASLKRTAASIGEIENTSQGEKNEVDHPTPISAADASFILQLPYMNACIEEVLRIYPPAPIGLPRIVRKGGMLLEGTHVPENTKVYVHMYSANHNARNFAQPDTFAPERWLKDPPVEFALDNRAAMQPFLYGPRVCVGINLAYVEMRLGLAHVLNEFNLNLCEESNDWINQKTYQLWEKKPLMVTLDAARK